MNEYTMYLNEWIYNVFEWMFIFEWMLCDAMT